MLNLEEPQHLWLEAKDFCGYIRSLDYDMLDDAYCEKSEHLRVIEVF